MKPHSYTSEGIVLDRRQFGEADRILSIFTNNHGRVSVIAKGIRRPKSRKRGHLEVFSRINFQAVSGRGIDIITEAEIIDNYKEIRKSLKKVSLAYYFAEVIGRITHENEKNEELYNFILNFFGKLKYANELKKLRIEFLNKLLIILGYWPEKLVLPDPDKKLEEVIERQIYSERVGKRMVQ